MFNYFSKLFDTFRNNTYPVKDIVPQKVYNAIDWGKTVVAGSYALQQFTNESWKSNDIDIMIKCDDINDFEKEVSKFITQTEGEVILTNLITTESRKNFAGTRDEAFHESVLGSCTIKVKDCDTPIQLVAINPKNAGNSTHNLSLIGCLNKITDVPACVSYTIENNQRIFHVPEKCSEALFTRRVYKNNICASRLQKYQERGFVFK